jgi:hemerythrin-like metal-binding protein
MAKIEWSESLSVKIESIDKQHQMLLSLVNDFYDHINSAEKRENLLKLINGLRSYIALHFNTEEMLMEKYNYPNFKKHKFEHMNFISSVNDYINRVRAGRLLISLEITNYLRDWITNHIQVTDKAYSEYLNSHGVK